MLLWFWMEFHISILLIVLSPYDRITTKILYSPYKIHKSSHIYWKLNTSSALTHFPWSCIPTALLRHINKGVFTLAVLKVNNLHSHTEVANALSGSQLYFSCVEKCLADAVLLKRWYLRQGSDPMSDIPAGTVYSALENILSGGEKFCGKH